MRTGAMPFLFIFASTAAFADYDAAQEARDKARRDAAQRAEQQRLQEAQGLKQDLNAKANADVMQAKRKALGAAADGKSDTEVNRLCENQARERRGSGEVIGRRGAQDDEPGPGRRGT